MSCASACATRTALVGRLQRRAAGACRIPPCRHPLSQTPRPRPLCCKPRPEPGSPRLVPSWRSTALRRRPRAAARPPPSSSAAPAAAGAPALGGRRRRREGGGRGGGERGCGVAPPSPSVWLWPLPVPGGRVLTRTSPFIFVFFSCSRPARLASLLHAFFAPLPLWATLTLPFPLYLAPSFRSPPLRRPPWTAPPSSA